VTALKTARLQSLLAYLVLRRNAPQPRSKLAFLFWPDSTEAQAHTNLRNLLHHLRRALPEADLFLQADAGTLGWRPDTPCTLDVADFENALAQAARAEETRHQTALRATLEGAATTSRVDDLFTETRVRLRP
jgi:DNA-binding SARP family transcriptional activator